MQKILLPYTIEHEDGCFLSHCPQLRVHTYGETRAEAVANLQEAVSGTVETLIEYGDFEKLMRENGCNVTTADLKENPVSVFLFEEQSVLNHAATLKISCLSPSLSHAR